MGIWGGGTIYIYIYMSDSINETVTENEEVKDNQEIDKVDASADDSRGIRDEEANKENEPPVENQAEEAKRVKIMDVVKKKRNVINV